jgi:hypothetical protein
MAPLYTSSLMMIDEMIDINENCVFFKEGVLNDLKFSTRKDFFVFSEIQNYGIGENPNPADFAP